MDAESGRPDKSHQSEGSRRPVKRGRLSFGYFSLAVREKSLGRLAETKAIGQNLNKKKAQQAIAHRAFFIQPSLSNQTYPS